MKDLLNLRILTKTLDDLSVGIGIFQVQDLNDIKSIRYVYMNKIILYEMRKEQEEVFGKRIIEVAPEAYEHEIGLQVIETYRKVAVERGSINLGVVEYSNHMVAGTYECSAHHILDNYVYVMLRNVTELEQTKNELAEINKNLEKIVQQRTLQLEKSKMELVEINNNLEERVKERTALLEQKNEELGQFAYVASHDLQEPLRTISSFIKLLENRYQGKLDKDADKYMGFISEASDRMSDLIKALLDHSSIGQAKEMTIVDCRQLVEVVQQDLAVIIKDTNTIFDIGKLPKIKGFETELRMLFQNLISNGIKFRKVGIAPKIRISAKEQDGWTFKIQDNGIGIADQNKDKIFSIFQRLHTKSEYEGTGIGLAHCKKIIELHKGVIWVNSKSGEGSTFYFTIPN